MAVVTLMLAMGVSSVGPVQATPAVPHANSLAVARGAPAAAGTPAEVLEGECDWDGLDDRCEAWTAEGGAGDQMAVDPTGQRIFTWGGPSIIAHDAATGETLWETDLAGISTPTVGVRGLAVDPQGEQIYAVGDDTVIDAQDPEEDRDVIVAAFEAATGTEVWRATLGFAVIDENDRYVSREQAGAVAVSPDGRSVYLTGDTRLYDRIFGWWITNDDVLIAGYDAASGIRRWVTTWGERFRQYHGTLIVVSPDSRNVYVGGTFQTCGGGINQCPRDFLTLGVRALRPAAPGQQGGVLWAELYDGFGGDDMPSSMALAPDGSRVYLTGASGGRTWPGGAFGNDGDLDWATVAYDGATGARSWVTRFQGPDDDRPDQLSRHSPDGTHVPSQLAVNPNGETVLVTGTFQSHALADVRDFVGGVAVGLSYAATLAYDAATGERRWAAYPTTFFTMAQPVLGPGHASPNTTGVSLDVSPDGKSVYALGQATAPGLDSGQITASFDSATGKQLWIARLSDHRGAELAASPDGSSLYTLSNNGSIQAYDAQP